MRKLWEDHVTWTRLAVISLIDESPDTNASVTRLLQNQQDIGDAIKPFYGNAAGDALAQLLREHILIAADLIAAAKSGDQGRVDAEQARWHQNAREIAAFLSHANPRYWKQDAITEMMFMIRCQCSKNGSRSRAGNAAISTASGSRCCSKKTGRSSSITSRSTAIGHPRDSPRSGTAPR